MDLGKALSDFVVQSSQNLVCFRKSKLEPNPEYLHTSKIRLFVAMVRVDRRPLTTHVFSASQVRDLKLDFIISLFLI